MYMWDVYLYEAQINKGNARAIDNKDGQNGRNEKNTMTRNNRDARNETNWFFGVVHIFHPHHR